MNYSNTLKKARDFANDVLAGARDYTSSLDEVDLKKESKKDSLLQKRGTNKGKGYEAQNDFFTEYYMKQREEIDALKQSNLAALSDLNLSDKQYNRKYMSNLNADRTGPPEYLGTSQEIIGDVIKEFEGFRSKPYDDRKKGTTNPVYRAGWGSDTITKEDGTILKVTKDMNVSEEDAQRDLNRRQQEFFQASRKRVGAKNWDRLDISAQAALTSTTYNYGTLPSSVTEAVKGGDIFAIADAVEALGVHNDSINMKRRKREAEIIRSTAKSGFIVNRGNK